MTRVELLLSEVNISMFELNDMWWKLYALEIKKLKKKENNKEINMYKKPNNNLKKDIKNNV